MPSRIISPFGTVSLFSGEHDSLLEQVFGQASERGQKPEDTVLSVDIFEDESRYVIWADLPGVDRSDIQLSCSDNVLTIAAETGQSVSEGDGHWLRRERRTGHLFRFIHIGQMLNTDAVSASLKDGVLEVQIPKHTSSERRTITIDSE